MKWNMPSLIIIPQVGVGGWMPSPRKLRLASSRIAVAIQRVDMIIISPATFGKICFDTIPQFDRPVALLASTYTCSATARVEARASLIYLGVKASPIARITFLVPAPKATTTIIANTIVGKDINTSVSHIITLLTLPLLYPAMRPKTVPPIAPTMVAKNPTDNETLEPHMVLESISLPYRSVPPQCCQLGSAKRLIT